MATTSFAVPAPMSFGLGALSSLPPLREQMGLVRPLVICEGHIHASATLSRVLRVTGPHLLFVNSSAQPLEKDLLDAAELYVIEGCDAIITVGDAGAMELAKGVRLKINHPLSLSDYESHLGGSARITADQPPLLAVPTLPGAGSAVSPSLVVTLDRNGRRVRISSPYLVPSAVIQDPELSLEVGPDCVRRAALTDLAEALDVYLSRGFHPICDAVALEGARLGREALLRLLEVPRDLDAMGSLIFAAVMSAMASEKGPGVTRAMGHLLHLRYRIPFGIARLLLVAAGSQVADGAVVARVSAVERQMQVSPLAQVLRDLAEQCGYPVRLRDWQVNEADIEALSTAIATDPGSLYECEASEVAALLRAAW